MIVDLAIIKLFRDLLLLLNVIIFLLGGGIDDLHLVRETWSNLRFSEVWEWDFVCGYHMGKIIEAMS